MVMKLVPCLMTETSIEQDATSSEFELNVKVNCGGALGVGTITISLLLLESLNLRGEISTPVTGETVICVAFFLATLNFKMVLTDVGTEEITGSTLMGTVKLVSSVF